MKKPFKSPTLLALVVSLSFTGSFVAQAQTPEAKMLQFATSPQVKPTFVRSAPQDAYLTQMRTRYELEKVVAGKKNDFERVKVVCNWVRRQWDHNGSNTPLKNDPLSILEEAATGKKFRCVEYGMVLNGALNSLGIPARSLALKMENADTVEFGAGHVVAEAYLRDQKKWIMVDGQFDVIPTLKGTPLNAVELQQAFAAGAPDLQVVSFSGTTAAEYFPWVAPYLFYFDTRLDNRFTDDRVPGSLMLVPQGAKNLTVFQRIKPLTDMTYTHSISDFYPKVK
ncbi:transglutaminase-like domain-containing protein [Rufibacter hautae]|uniref:Transglutaminase domain-containing protein n=1 Tax=Rufibacter hautae TaxID=2595005 RepID=A0A5B6TBA3_9BACT|nr:transglutaminase-like domain-containing protein [Rufibacter hautae]KAA3437145.1 transglutaminase domain-containing protein [Rufibacter hautae]